MITPVKPSSPRSSPSSAAADWVAGRAPVSPATRRCPGITAATPAAIAAANGGRSRSRTRARPPSTLAITDRKSTRLNSSHVRISYAGFGLKKKKKTSKQGNDERDGVASMVEEENERQM